MTLKKEVLLAITRIGRNVCFPPEWSSKKNKIHPFTREVSNFLDVADGLLWVALLTQERIEGLEHNSLAASYLDHHNMYDVASHRGAISMP